MSEKKKTPVDQFREWYGGLKPEDQKKTTILLVILTFVVVVVLSSTLFGGDTEKRRAPKDLITGERVAPAVDKNLLERSKSQTTQLQVEKLLEQERAERQAMEQRFMEALNQTAGRRAYGSPPATSAGAPSGADSGGGQPPSGGEGVPLALPEAGLPQGTGAVLDGGAGSPAGGLIPPPPSVDTGMGPKVTVDGASLVVDGEVAAEVDENGMVNATVADGEVFVGDKKVGDVLGSQVVADGAVIGSVFDDGRAVIDATAVSSAKPVPVAGRAGGSPPVTTSPRLGRQRTAEERWGPAQKGADKNFQRRYMQRKVNLVEIPPPAEETKSPSSREDEDKKKATLYLSSGALMPATLLMGVAAPATLGGSKVPHPIEFRIHDVAILPNAIKANLKGCFALGQAIGDLSTQRAKVKIVRLSCIARDSTSVIDQEVEGWVTDADGKADLGGTVVYKAGAALARVGLAGLLAGAGEAIDASSQTITTTGLGAVSTTDPASLGKSAFGSAASKAANHFAEFYLDLAKQTFPVIEVMGGKQVMIHIWQGVELEIKEQCLTVECS